MITKKINYFKNHPWYQYEQNIKLRDHIVTKFNKELYNYVPKLKSWKILEIWVGIGNFAHYCHLINTQAFTWIDIDDYFFSYHRQEFPKFNFVKARFQDFLKNINEEYDVVFTSHLFEHLDEIERVEIIQYINQALKKWWIWINYMPNADSVLRSNLWMYNDITHFRIYNDNSFLQVVGESWVHFSEIIHLNNYIWYGFFKRFVHKISLFFTKLYFLSQWIAFPKIYSFEIFSILKK